MQNRIKTIAATIVGANQRQICIVLLPALLLAGCGNSPSPNADIEARLAAVEEKVEQAEIRSKKALSMAATSGSSFGPSPAEPEEFSGDTGPDEQSYGSSPVSPNQMIGPPSPGQDGPPNPQMMPGG